MAKKTDKQKSPAGFTVIYGADPFLVSRECQCLLDALLDPQERDMALYEPKADEARMSDVLEELATLPFLASRRVVLIKGAEPFIKENLESLEKYIDTPSPSGLLILTATSWDKRLRLHKKLQAAGGLIEVADIKSYQMPAYVTAYAQQTHGIRLDGSCSRFLVELAGDDPGRLCREMDKLAVYVAPAKTVSMQDIEALIGQNRLFNAFDVIDAITAERTGDAITRLRAMFGADRDTEYTVVGAFGFHFRRLFRAKAMIEQGASPQQAAAKAGVRFKTEEFLRQAARLSLPQIGRILAELGRIDIGLKTGQTTASAAMERLILKIFSVQKNASF
ncbi:MAG: DNA polymerase III subunit delta [Planctomycetales bacterium]|nr:DNA polymerase III subunit delta [Planctomycetales bacterium]